jgi:hypothetical protein
MKSIFFYLFVVFIFTSCQDKVSKESLSMINGYWEIQKVEFPNHEKKEYTVNETVDFIEWKNEKGFRKKVTPQLDGTYLTNDEFETIQIKDSSGHFYLFYQTKYSKWKEQIQVLTDSILIVKNEQGFEYHYKRFKPISIQ